MSMSEDYLDLRVARYIKWSAIANAAALVLLAVAPVAIKKIVFNEYLCSVDTVLLIGGGVQLAAGLVALFRPKIRGRGLAAVLAAPFLTGVAILLSWSAWDK